MDGWHRWYPPTLFPSLWKKIDELIAAALLVSSEEVYHELERKTDDLFEWAKARRQLFLALDQPVQTAVTEVLAQFPRLVDSRTGKSFADPFVIATAQITKTIIITGETATGSPERRPKIPDACAHYGIECLNLVELIRREGWKF
jgi:hypothetical protein